MGTVSSLLNYKQDIENDCSQRSHSQNLKALREKLAFIFMRQTSDEITRRLEARIVEAMIYVNGPKLANGNLL